MKSEIINDKLYRFFACVMIAETLSVTLHSRMPEIERIRGMLNSFNTKVAERIGDWVDELEPYMLALADADTLFPVLLMKAYRIGRKYRELAYANDPKQTVFPWDDELAVFKQKAEEMNYNRELYKLLSTAI